MDGDLGNIVSLYHAVGKPCLQEIEIRKIVV